MKTNLSNIVRAGSACPLFTAASLALAITLTLTLTSCGKDKSKESGNAKLLEYITDDAGDVIERFEYDKQNRIVKVIRDYRPTTITYSGDDLITVVSGTDTTKYAKKGNIITVESIFSPGTLTIDKDGYIVKDSDNRTYQYENGNLTKISYGEEGDSYTYDDKKSRFFNTNTPKWLLQREFGYEVKNNILAIKTSEVEYQNYEYEYDSEGFAIKETLVEGWYSGDSEMPMTIRHFVYSGRTAEEIAAFDAARLVVKKEKLAAEEAEKAAALAKAERVEALEKEAAAIVKAAKEKALKEGRTFTDERDGKIYMWVKIGTQTWMAENLNYDVKEDCRPIEHLAGACYAIVDYCYGNPFGRYGDESKCGIYGRIYDSETAKEVCPSGWHLPSYEEWQTLVNFAGGEKVAGKKLKAKSGWNNNEGKSGNGTDAFGFSALPGGGLFPNASDSDLDYEVVGDHGYWMGVTDDFCLRTDPTAGVGKWGGYAYSVRCIKDEDKTSALETDQTTINNEVSQ